jgi:maleylpyruvate isomerase
MKLHNFFRSGSSHRVRIALNLKGLVYEYVAVDLRRDEHLSSTFLGLNAQGMVPALEDDGEVMIQSPAIIEWLEECHPVPPLLPDKAEDRARVRALAAIVACDIHPLNNRRVLETLRRAFGANDAAVDAWSASWIGTGFDAIEALLAADGHRSEFCVGNSSTLADVYLLPQVESARRFKVDLTRWPRIESIDAACSQIDAFRRAVPALQADGG